MRPEGERRPGAEITKEGPATVVFAEIKVTVTLKFGNSQKAFRRTQGSWGGQCKIWAGRLDLKMKN